MRMPRFVPRPARDEDGGYAMLFVVIAIGILTVLPVGILNAVSGQLPLARADQDRQTALGAAQAGIDDYLNHLNQNPNYWQYTAQSCANKPTGAYCQAESSNQALPTFNAGGQLVGSTWKQVSPGSSGSFQYFVDNTNLTNYQNAANPDESYGLVYLTVNGRSRNVTRTVQVSFRQASFLDYLSVSDYNIVDPGLDSLPLNGTNGNTPSASWTTSLCKYHVPDVNTYANANVGGNTHGPYLGGAYGQNNCGQLLNYWISGQVLNGAILSNDEYYICGTPDFQAKVGTADLNTADAPYYTGNVCPGQPTFAVGGGIAQHASISFANAAPTDAQLQTYASPTTAHSGCRYYGPTSISFSGSTMTVVSPATSAYSAANPASYPASALAACVGTSLALPSNGLLYVNAIPNGTSGCVVTAPFGTGGGTGWLDEIADPTLRSTLDACYDGDAFVQGSVTGQVTVGANNNVYITGATTGASSSSGSSVLGLVANNFVLINHPVHNTQTAGCPTGMSPCVPFFGSTYFPAVVTNPTLTAAIFSRNDSLGTAWFTQGGALGTLTINGSISGVFMDIEGTFDSHSGALIDGYNETYNYDARLGHLSPPYFPSLGINWRLSSYGELPPCANPTPLAAQVTGCL